MLSLSPPRGLRAAIYTRVSSTMQLDNFSLDAQRDICAALVESRQWRAIGHYSDEGISAKTTERPQFKAMLAAARAGEIDVIVVHKLDRFSRSVVDLLLTMRELEESDVSVVSATEQFDFSTPIGKVLLTLLAAFAQWYLDNLAVEVSKGKRARAEAGHWQNRLPFGYTTTYKSEGGDSLALPDEHDRQGYELAVSLAESGEYSYRQIGEALNKAGYRPTGRAGARSLKLWSTDSVRHMLRNRFYLGEVSYKGEWFAGLHEALITEARWQRVQDTMRARRTAHAFKASRTARFYLLSGLVRCAECHSPLRGEYRKDTYKERVTEYRYYRCSARYRNVSCAAPPFVRADRLESQVEAYLTRFTLDANAQRKIRDRAQQIIASQAPATSANEARRLKAELERLKDLYRFGDIERAAYLSERDELRARLDALPRAHSARRLHHLADTLAGLGELWAVATDPERRKLVRQIIARVDVGTDTVIITPRPDYGLLLVD